VLHKRTSELFRELAVAHADGSIGRFLVRLSRIDILLLGSPRLLEPECRSPRQMQLANALCRFVELASVLEPATQPAGA